MQHFGKLDKWKISGYVEPHLGIITYFCLDQEGSDSSDKVSQKYFTDWHRQSFLAFTS